MKMELLCPAGSPESLKAAVQGGANAVYLGYGNMNARRNAKNFSKEELIQAVNYCHLRGVKVYLTMNTLVSDREISSAFEIGNMASDIGIDAVLVQDLGVAKLLRDTVPDIPLHASTQMTVHNLDGIKACQDLGMTRVVLSRELPWREIEFLCEHSPLEIEIFGHGALCMCYSGQCYMSAVLGGRSGNRGLCAQPCRLSFRWDGDKNPSRPLSLKDLSLADYVSQLEKMGVACLKLEGRMKRPEYVYITAKIYSELMKEGRKPSQQEIRTLEKVFSRNGFTQGYYLDEKGPRMFGYRKEGTRDPEELFSEVRKVYEREETRKVPIHFSAEIRTGMPVTVKVEDSEGDSICIEGQCPEKAKTRSVTAEKIKEQLYKTGGTVYKVEKCDTIVEDGLSLPISSINELRRKALSRLDEMRIAVPSRRKGIFEPNKALRGNGKEFGWIFSFRRWSQVSEEILEKKPDIIYLPVDEYVKEKSQIQVCIRKYPDIMFAAVLPRVAWNREIPQVRMELACAAEIGVRYAVIGHIGQISMVREFSLIPRGDFGLGVQNSLTIGELKRLGLESCTVSFENRMEQIRDLSKDIPAEMIVYGRLPLMIMENCIIKNRGNGCTCDKIPATLEDRKGESFPVERAWGCRNEVFNAKVLWLADKSVDWLKAGVRYGRLNFVREEAQECLDVVECYMNSSGKLPNEFTRGLYYRGVE